MEITMGLSKAGPEVRAETSLPMMFSNVFLNSPPPKMSTSSHVTLRAPKTQQMDLPEGFTDLDTFFSHPSTSPRTRENGSLTGTHRSTPTIRQARQSQSLSPRKTRPTSIARQTSRANSSSTPESSGGNTNKRFNTALPLRPAIAARPYKSHLTPAISILRIHCAARDRLILWLPAKNAQALDPVTPSTATSLSEQDMRRVFDTLQFAYSPDTLAVYGSGLLVYHCWCDTHGISELDRAPAPTHVIEAFIASCSGAYSRTAIENSVAGIQAWHLLHHLPWNPNKSTISHLYKAAGRLAPTKRNLRPPLTLDLMRTLFRHLDLTSSLDTAVKACLLITFWCTARLGEFTLKNLTDFDVSHQHVRPSHLSRTRDVATQKTILTFHLPWTKVKDTGEDVYCMEHPEDADCDPLSAIDMHLTLNQPPPSGFLFAYKHGRSGYRCLTKQTMWKRLGLAATMAGTDLPTGHSARIGSTLWHLLNGTPPDAMKIKGRWASDTAWARYLRKHTEIMAPYLQANPTLHQQITRVVLPPVRAS